MTSGLHRGQGRKREHETRYPEPRREMKPALLGLTFKAHLFHPKPAFLASLPPAALVFFQTNKQTSQSHFWAFAQAGASAWNALSHSSPSTAPRSPASSSGSLPGFLSRGHHFCSVLPQPLCAFLLFHSFHHCVVKGGCMGQPEFSAQDAMRSGWTGQEWGGTQNTARKLW